MAATQRTISARHEGQILLSGVTNKLACDTLLAGAGLVELGMKRLKDLLRPEHLYQLNDPGLPESFPLLQTLDGFPNNLPYQLTSFVGRANGIAELKAELESHRDITRTGSGCAGSHLEFLSFDAPPGCVQGASSDSLMHYTYRVTSKCLCLKRSLHR